MVIVIGSGPSGVWLLKETDDRSGETTESSECLAAGKRKGDKSRDSLFPDDIGLRSLRIIPLDDLLECSPESIISDGSV